PPTFTASGTSGHIFLTFNPVQCVWCVCVCVFTGRGQKSHAYTHSVQFTHHVFLNLHTLKFYCLPDNYEIIDSSLEDITVSSHICNIASYTCICINTHPLKHTAVHTNAYSYTSHRPVLVAP